MREARPGAQFSLGRRFRQRVGLASECTKRPQCRRQHGASEQREAREWKCGNHRRRGTTFDRFVEATGNSVATIRSAYVEIVAIERGTRRANPFQAHVCDRARVAVVAGRGIGVELTTAGGKAAVVGADVAVVAGEGT